MKISIAKKLIGRYCCAYRCSGKPVKKLGGLCSKCSKRKLKEEDKILYRYYNFRGNAKRRGHDFTITIEEFRHFCKVTGYMTKKGFCGFNATIDRINNDQGYHIWNIQILGHRANCRKGTDSWNPEEIEQPWLF